MAGLGSLFSGVIEGYKGVSGILDNVEAQAWHGEYMKAWRESRDKLKSREADADKNKPVGTAVTTTPDTPMLAPVPPKPTPTSAPVGSTPAPPAPPAPTYTGTAPGSGTMATGGAVPAAAGRARVPGSLLSPTIPAVDTPAHTALDRALNTNADIFSAPQPAPVDKPVVLSPGGAVSPAVPLSGVGYTIGGTLRETIEQSPRTGFYNTVDAMGRGLGTGLAAIPGVIEQQLTQPRQFPRAIDSSVPNYIIPPTAPEMQPYTPPATAAPSTIQPQTATDEFGRPAQIVIPPRAVGGRLF